MQAIETIVQEAARGSLPAFETLVMRFQDMAVGYAYAILGDHGYAQDAAQEAFIQVYTNLPRLQDPAAFPGWFKRVVFSSCTRITRKKVKETMGIDDLAEILRSDPAGEPDQAFERKDLRRQVWAVIQALPEEQRSVLILYYINDFSYQEIADFLGLPQHTVTNRLHAAKKFIKKELWNMVEDSIKNIRVSGNEKFVRKVLADVPRVSFYTTGNICPQDIILPGVMRAFLASIGEDYGYAPIQAHGQEWKLDMAATFFAGVSGAPFKFFWNPRQWTPVGWIDPAYMTVYGDLHIRRSFEAAGYACEVLLKPDLASKLPYQGKLLGNEAETRKQIIASIDAGRPVIALGIVGPAEPCLVAGYDEDGVVLLGWNYFQDEPGTNAGLDFEPNGYFRKRDWYGALYGLVLVGEKTPKPPLKQVYRQSLEWGLELLKRPEVAGFAAGWASFDEWANLFLAEPAAAAPAAVGEEPAAEPPASPFRRYVEYVQPTIWELAERRWYGAMFIEEHMLRNAPDLPAEALGRVANCFHDVHDTMWKIAAAAGLMEGDPLANLANPDTRREIAGLIQAAKTKDMEAAQYLEQALSLWK